MRAARLPTRKVRAFNIDGLSVTEFDFEKVEYDGDCRMLRNRCSAKAAAYLVREKLGSSLSGYSIGEERYERDKKHILQTLPRSASTAMPLAGVELAEEYERHSEYPVLGFGDCVPSAILTFDRSYEIVLERSEHRRRREA